MDTQTVSIDPASELPPADSSLMQRPDYLAAALVHALLRPMENSYAWPMMRIVGSGVLSMGVIPLLMLPRRWRQFVAHERDQLWHLADWMRKQFGADAQPLWRESRAARRVTTAFQFIELFCALSVFLIAFVYLMAGHNLLEWLRATYGHYQNPPEMRSRSETLAFAAWTIMISLGFAVHWVSIVFHQLMNRRFLARFNQLAVQRNVEAVVVPAIVFGLQPAWLLIGLCFAASGLFWGLPMMLAGAAHRRYISCENRACRAALARRVDDRLAERQRGVRVEIPIALRPRCAQPRCLAPLPLAARFCSRCGASAAGLA